MSKKRHYYQLPETLAEYAEERGVVFHRYSPYHMRLIYNPRIIFDCWTTAKYWVKYSDYRHGIVERGNETGVLPISKNTLYKWLDELFFAVEIKENKELSHV